MKNETNTSLKDFSIADLEYILSNVISEKIGKSYEVTIHEMKFSSDYNSIVLGESCDMSLTINDTSLSNEILNSESKNET